MALVDTVIEAAYPQMTGAPTTERAHDDRHHRFPPLVNSSLYAISPGVALADVRELLEVKRMHLTALLVMTCGVVGAGHVQ